MFPTCSLLVQTDLHQEILELAASAQYMMPGDTKGVL